MIPELGRSLEEEMTTHCNILVGNPVDRGAWWSRVHRVASSIVRMAVSSIVHGALESQHSWAHDGWRWLIVALPWCVNFCSLMKWVSCVYTYIPPSWTTLPSLGRQRALSWASCTTQQLPTSYLFHMVRYLCQSRSLCSSRPLLPHRVYLSILYVCVSILALQIGSSVAFF